MLNQLQHNIVWRQTGNFIDVPTDCPQRDERLGWTGDAQVFVRAATFNADVAAFFTKWLQDLDDAQGYAGQIPSVAPTLVGRPARRRPGLGGRRRDLPVDDLHGLRRHPPARRALRRLARYIDYLVSTSHDLIRCHPRPSPKQVGGRGGSG